MKISCHFCSYRAAILLLMCVCSAVCFDEVLVKRDERRTLVSTEYGHISAARVSDHTIDGSYLLHFFTLDPNSLFLPVILHADMVFYVHTGSGRLRWREEDEVKSSDLRRGDVHRLQEGSIFLIQSNLDTESERQKLRIHAIFPNSDKYLHENAPYSSIRDMLLGFDKRVLQAAFKVNVEEIEELVNGAKPPAIIHGLSEAKNRAWEMEARFVEGLFGSRASNIFQLNKKKKKVGTKLYNLFDEDKDFENCNGWSTTVTRKKLRALKGTDIGLFMVNLTEGSMMGPHWNPVATEIGVVLQGRGMIRAVCPGKLNETGCRDMRYAVEEGDTFVVPRFHAMAQMAFNNGTLVFMGFATSAKRNHPQYLAGKASVLRTLDRDVIAIAFNVTNTTLDQLVNSQQDSVILGCVSCAEEEFKILEEEIEKERAAEREREAEEARKREEEKRREEEEERKREEEEAKREEEERKRREEEEEARKREEEKRREEEEERKKEEEEAKREEEERQRQEEEEEARKREEEKRREEEEERKREEEEAKREEEERQRQEEEEEEEKRREEEEEQKREEEERERHEEEEERETREEEARKREEEAARRAEEERRRREEEEAQEKEEEAARRAEEGRKREEEEAQEREEEEEREEEAARRAEEERKRKVEEEEEEERKRQEEAAAARREEERERKAEEEKEVARREEEEAAASRRREEEEEEAPVSWRHVMKKRLIHQFPTAGQAHFQGRTMKANGA